jgi:hypothetical protein
MTNTLINIIENYNVKIITIINNNDSILNTKIQKIWVINLLEDTIKRNYIITLMKKCKINFTLVIVDKISDNIYQTLCPHKNISKEEMDNCSSFCENQYFKKYEDQKYHPQGINSELKKGVIDSCKARFCNPRCPYPNRANKSLRYACDTCKKTFSGLQKLGAITNCDYDSLFNR